MASQRSLDLKSLAWRLIRLASHLPPPVRASIHFRLFCTPLAHSRDPDEVAYLQGGKPFFLPCGPFTIPGWVYPQKGPCVVLAHGWQGSAASWATLIERLRADGFRVVVYNAPGHHYRPWRSSLPDFTRALRQVMETFEPEVLVGHSFGAMTVARILPHYPQLRAAALYSPPNRLTELAHGFCRSLKLSEPETARFFEKLQSTFEHSLETEAVERYLKEQPVPVKIWHDIEDDVVPIQASRTVHQSTGTPLVETGGLGHRKIIRDPALAAEVSEFLQQRCSPPSIK